MWHKIKRNNKGKKTKIAVKMDMQAPKAVVKPNVKSAKVEQAAPVKFSFFEYGISLQK